MAIPTRPAPLLALARVVPTVLLVMASALSVDRARAEDPVPTDKQGQAAWAALAHVLSSQRLEGVMAAVVLAGEPENPAPPAPVNPVVLEDRFRGPVAVAEVVGIQNGPAAAVMLQRGLQAGLWEVKPQKSPFPDKDMLTGIEDRKPVLNADQNSYESRAYCYLVFHAREIPVDALSKVASKQITYAHLWDDPKKYRGEPIHIEGRLKKLTRMDAPKILWNDGIRTLYEAWVFPEEYGANPFCVIFSELPKGVQTGEKIEYPVTFDAYFFKRYRYATVNRETRDAPLFIGRTFAIQGVKPAKPEAPGVFDGMLVPTVMAFVAGLVVLFFGLTWWFRRGDRVVQSRIREARGTGFVEPGVNESPHDRTPLPDEEPQRMDGPGLN
ncbi:MAG: hypothetical protein K2R98_08305 [Gemmataceae bacterium]|nr:hypothetical protein [Gemmataceae bacterium]